MGLIKEPKDVDFYSIDKPRTIAEKKKFSKLIGKLKPSSKNEIEKYNKEIDAAVKRVRSGKSVSNNIVMKEMNSW
jgi:hypothetical protein